MSVLKTFASGYLLFVTRNLFAGNDKISISKAQCFPARVPEIIIRVSARFLGIHT